MVLSLCTRLWDNVRNCYYHYSLITTIIILEPMERYAFNAFFSIFVSLFLYTTVVYLPGHLAMMANFLTYLAGLVEPVQSETTAEEMIGS